MPLYYVSLKAENVKNSNKFTIPNSHRIESTNFQLKSATVVLNPLPMTASIVTTPVATPAVRSLTSPIPGGNATILLDFSSQNVVRERQIISNVNGGGQIPIPFDYTQERAQQQYQYLDNNIHFSDVPFVFNIEVYKSDGVTPFPFQVGNGLTTIFDPTNGSTLKQIDLVFSYEDLAEEPLC